ncbi:MAG: DoxX family protein [Phyllobacteriaceae bacterium]|nr:DoxX family protein [Phyllobacteriaceae bacterium]
MFSAAIRLHNTAFGAIERNAVSWLPGLFARFAFAAVLLVYYLNSFSTKIGTGPLGVFSVADNAYYQILPSVIEAAGYDVANVGLGWKLVVWAGTYAELILPLLIVAGLFTRLASLGMMGFITVQSLVDVWLHKIGPEATGAWFDRFSDAAILDQRLMWFVPLVLLVIQGAGAISLDHLLARNRT